MNEFNNFSEVKENDSVLLDKAKENTDKEMRVSVLNRSVVKDMSAVNAQDTLDSDEDTEYATDDTEEKDEGEEEALTDEEKKKIKDETGWSDEIVDCIDSMKQYEIYKNADLHEAEIDGRKCLVKNIDMAYVDSKTGMTNKELMSKGRSPIDAKTGQKIELHHMGQKADAPFVELAENSEHGDGNHSVLHPKTEGSWRNTPELEKQYRNEKCEHWKARSLEE